MAKKRLKEAKKGIVERYIRFAELRDCLASGWSPDMTRKYLHRQYPDAEVPSERSIRRWKDANMREALIVPQAHIRRALQGVSYKVDALGLLSQMIPVLQDRIGRSMEVEQREFGGLAIGATDKAQETFNCTLAQWTKLAQDLGLVDVRDTGPIVDARSLSLNIPADALPDVMTRLESTATKLREMRQQGLIGGGRRAGRIENTV